MGEGWIAFCAVLILSFIFYLDNKRTKGKTYEQLGIKSTNKKEKYYCPDCNRRVHFGDEKCKICDCKLDWSDEEE